MLVRFSLAALLLLIAARDHVAQASASIITSNTRAAARHGIGATGAGCGSRVLCGGRLQRWRRPSLFRTWPSLTATKERVEMEEILPTDGEDATGKRETPEADGEEVAAKTAAVSVGLQETKAFNTPKQILTAIVDTAALKAKTATPDLLLSGFLAGAYISFGGALMFTINSNLGGLREAGMGGLATLIAASVFPVCFVIHVLAGSELWTGNCAVLGAGALQGKCTWVQTIRHWTLAFLGNFAGALTVAYFLIFQAGLANEALSAFLGKLAAVKTSLSFNEAFLRGVGANWLVCLAVLLVQSAMSVPGKILGAWFPIMAFVAIGFEHSVANMFAIPLAYMTNAASFMEFKDLFLNFLQKNLLPVTLGNIVGGLVFVGMFYNRILLKPQMKV